MSRPPSAKTTIANLTRAYNQKCKDLNETRYSLTQLSTRVTRAEKELEEWKQRFDELLKLRNERTL